MIKEMTDNRYWALTRIWKGFWTTGCLNEVVYRWGTIELLYVCLFALHSRPLRLSSLLTAISVPIHESSLPTNSYGDHVSEHPIQGNLPDMVLRYIS